MRDRSTGVHAAAPAILLGLAALLWPDAALAQGDVEADGVGLALNKGVEALKTVLDDSGAMLAERAQQMLLFLLVLDFVWRGGKWALSSQSFSDFAEPLVYTIGLVTLVWGLTENLVAFVEWITTAAGQLSGRTGTAGEESLKPARILEQGFQRVLVWTKAAKWTDPESWAFLLCAFISLIVMAVELAMVILIYAELYLLGLAGVVALGFAGLTQTRGVATRYVMMLFGKGFKLLALLIVVNATHLLARVAEESLRTTTPEASKAMRFADVTAGEYLASVTVAGAMAAILLQLIGVVLIIMLPGAMERLVAGSASADVAGPGAKMVAGAAMTGGGAALGAAGGAAAGAAAAGKAAATGPFRAGLKDVTKAAATGGLKGGVNWTALGSQGKILNELGSRLQGRVNRMGDGKGS